VPGLTLGPFHLHRRHGDEQGAGKIALRADAGLDDRLLGRFLGEALRQGGRHERVGIKEVHRAGDAGAQAVGGEAGDAVDAGPAGGEGGPIVGLPLPEGRDDAEARHRDQRPAMAVTEAL
jgi:hypothetical protein